MTSRSLVFVSVSALAILCSGCHLRLLGMTSDIPGSGTILSVTRSVGSFTELEIHKALEAEFEVADEVSLSLEGDDNLLSLVKTQVIDDRLVVEVESGKSIRPSKRLLVRVKGPSLVGYVAQGASRLAVRGVNVEDLRLKATGASVVDVQALTATRLGLEVEGASQLRVEGVATQVTADVAGASKLDASKLSTVKTQLTVSGASDVQVMAQDVSGTASGASRVIVLGEPKTHEIKTSGASSVAYKN